MDWMLLPLRRYAEFSGRSRRREYWMFTLFVVLVSIILTMIDMMLGLTTAAGGVLTLLFSLAVLVPSLAVGVRRLHDSERSGWWLLIGLVPFVGVIVLLVFMVLPGTRGANRFGPDPIDQTA